MLKYFYCIWCALAMVLCSLESFRVLQNASYKPQRGYIKVFFTWYYLQLLILVVFSFVWRKYLEIPAILCGVYTFFGLLQVFVRRKSPLKITKRILRMLVVDFCLLAVGCFFFLEVWVAVLPLIGIFAWLLCLPIDTAINNKFLKRAQQKLFDSKITVIAITGSYGKTSTKNMLADLLDNSIAPSGSCNTPLGIAKFINGTNLADAKFLILEFGARKRGDIAQLCKLYRPKFGIVTGVCPQHLSTFKSFENVVATKRELVECLPSDGVCVIGDSSVESFWGYGACKTVKTGGVKISKLKVTPNGLEFVARRGKISAEIKLPHITPHSVNTFSACAVLCFHLGQPFDVTVANVVRVKQTEHRMQISHNGKFFIIDDSYNGSISGVESCCEVLKHFEGSKIAIVQGLVECGSQRKTLNVRCGKLLGDVCSVIILVGKNSKYLQEGTSTSLCNTVICAKNLQNAVALAQPYLSRNCFLLFQNDLPDVVSI